MTFEQNNISILPGAPFPICDVVAVYFWNIIYILDPQDFPPFPSEEQSLAVHSDQPKRFELLTDWISGQAITVSGMEKEQENIQTALAAQFPWLKELKEDRQILRLLKLHNSTDDPAEKTDLRDHGYSLIKKWITGLARKKMNWLFVKPMTECRLYAPCINADSPFKHLDPARLPLDDRYSLNRGPS